MGPDRSRLVLASCDMSGSPEILQVAVRSDDLDASEAFYADDSLGPAGHDERHAFVRDPSGNLVGLVELTRS